MIPLLGFTDYGEDANLPAINHPLGFVAMDAAVYSGAYSGAAAAAEGSGTCAAMSQCLIDGDILRLKASFKCPVGARHTGAMQPIKDARYHADR